MKDKQAEALLRRAYELDGANDRRDEGAVPRLGGDLRRHHDRRIGLCLADENRRADG